MKIVVCIKQVPDSEAKLKVSADQSWIDEEELPFVINESDEYALEEALQIAEKNGGEVVAVSLGPERVKEALRKALALGATRAVHLSDPAFSGGDALATARALAAVVRREEADLVLTGSQSSDLGFGATGTALAGELGWPHAWLVMGVEIDDEGQVEFVREMEAGLNEVARMPMPAVIEVQAGINTPRYASLKGIMQAKRKELAALTPDELGLEEGDIGAAGSRLELLAVREPEPSGEVEILEGDPAAVAKSLVEKLRKEARVI